MTRHAIFSALAGLSLAAACCAGARGEPAGDNAADRYRAAFARLSVTEEERTHIGDALTAESDPGPDVQDLLARHAEALKELAAAAALERCDFAIAYERGCAAPLEHLPPLRDLGRMVCLRARLAAAAGRWAETAEDLAACLRLCRHLREDRTALSSVYQATLVFAATRTALRAFERVLPPAEFCERLEPLLEGARVDFGAALEWEVYGQILTLKWMGERPSRQTVETFRLLPEAEPLSRGDPVVGDALGALAAKIGKPAARIEVLRSYDDLRALLLEDADAYRAWMSEAVAAWKLPPPDADEALKGLTKRLETMSVAQRSLAPNFRGYWRREQDAAARLAILRVLLFLARDRRTGRELPRTWPEVAARMGAEAPRDPATGGDFVFRAGPNGVHIVSESAMEGHIAVSMGGLGTVADVHAATGQWVFLALVAVLLTIGAIGARLARRDPRRWSLAANPVFRRELRHRGWAWLGLSFVSGLALCAELGGLLWWKAIAPVGPEVCTGEKLFGVGLGGLIVLALGAAPALTVAAVAGEREAGTGESMVGTGFPRESLLLGKLAAVLAPLWLPVAVHTVLQPTGELLGMLRTGTPMWMHGWAVIAARWVSPAGALLMAVGAALACGVGRARVVTGVVVACLALGAAVVLWFAGVWLAMLGFMAVTGVLPTPVDLPTWMLAGSVFPVAAVSTWAFRRAARRLDRHLAGGEAGLER